MKKEYVRQVCSISARKQDMSVFFVILKSIIKMKDHVKVAMFYTYLFKKKEWKHSIRYYPILTVAMAICWKYKPFVVIAATLPKRGIARSCWY